MIVSGIFCSLLLIFDNRILALCAQVLLSYIHEICQINSGSTCFSLFKFGLVGLVWQIWFGRFGLVGLVQ